MFKALMKRWQVTGTDLAVILLVFAITGTATAWLSGAVTGWVGVTEQTHWLPRLLLRLAVLLIGYQVILLTVAFLAGQFPFFWRFEKKLLQRMRLLKTEVGSRKSEVGGQRSEVGSQEEGTRGQESQIRNQESEIVRLAVFASGAGSNAEKLIAHFKESSTATVALVVCNKPEAGVIAIAERAGVPVLLIEREPFFRGDGYVPQLQQAGIGFIVLAGFLWKVPQSLIAAYPRRIVNIHPALLPKFGGKGMYGRHVHQAVLAAGEVESGITIHYVDEHYDSGDVIFQTACPVLPTDGPDDVAARVHRLEHLHYPRVVEEVVQKLK